MPNNTTAHAQTTNRFGTVGFGPFNSPRPGGPFLSPLGMVHMAAYVGYDEYGYEPTMDSMNVPVEERGRRSKGRKPRQPHFEHNKARR